MQACICATQHLLTHDKGVGRYVQHSTAPHKRRGGEAVCAKTVQRQYSSREEKWRRASLAEDYFTLEELVWLLVRTVANGGNLLLNVGPSSDGRIPEVEQERILGIGRWLEVNGAAIYGSKLWRVLPFALPL